MVRTRAANVNQNPRPLPQPQQAQAQPQQPNINFERQRVATTKKIKRRVRVSDVKIKFLLPQIKNVEVIHKGNVVRKMKVRRVAKHTAKKRHVRYG